MGWNSEEIYGYVQESTNVKINYKSESYEGRKTKDEGRRLIFIFYRLLSLVLRNSINLTGENACIRPNRKFIKREKHGS